MKNLLNKKENRQYFRLLHKIPIAMRITLILLFGIILQLEAGNVYSQTALVSLDMKGVSVEKVLNTIEEKSEFYFLYNSKLIDVDRKVSINAKGQTIESVLNNLFGDTDVAYKVENRQIILSPRGMQNAEPMQDTAPGKRRVKGFVKDQNGQPVIGATVAEKGVSTSGTMTGPDGEFSLSVGEQSTLVVSCIGYVAREVAVKNNNEIFVTLAEDHKLLDEVVVVGYGTQKKVNLTGAVSIVDSKALEDRPLARVSQMIQGTVPNMNVTFGSGYPGAGANINIRGVNSVGSTTNARPLVLIDGIEGDLDRINPSDVQSISVLKDASASAVYGARASYGVILVTTKEGTARKTVISYSGRYGVNRNTTSTDFESRGYYSAGINDLFFSNYSGTKYSKYTEEDYYQLWLRRDDKTEHPDRPWVMIDQRDGRDTYVYYANTDWYNVLYRESWPTWSHNVSVSGGNDKVNYYMSGNVFDQEGVFRTNPDHYRVYNFRSKMSAQILPNVRLTNNTKYHSNRYSYPGISGINNNFNRAVNHALASFVPQNPDGTLVYTTSLSNYQVLDGMNAVLLNDKHRNKDRKYEFTTAFELVIDLFKDLEVRANYNYSHYNYQTMNCRVNHPYSKYPGVKEKLVANTVAINQLSEIQTNHWYHVFNAYATYNKSIAKDHNIKAMGGYNYESRKLKDLKATRADMLSDDFNDVRLGSGNMTTDGGQNEYAIMGLFYRLNYDYKGRYLLETSGRYDGSSRFRRGDRFGFFPSASVGWRISEEPFFTDLKSAVDNLKVRLSYGSLGNQQTSLYYGYMVTMNTGNLSSNYAFGDGQKMQYSSSSAPNAEDLTWETVSTVNLGLDMGFFNNRLTFSGDIYERRTTDMLALGKDLPATYGATIPQKNSADLKTKGWELSVRWEDSFGLGNKPFRYNIGVGLADNTSKITKFDNPARVLGQRYVGENLGEIWGYCVDGYFLTDEEAANYHVDQSTINNIINTSAVDKGLHAGDMKFLDLDGDNKITKGTGTVDNPGDRKVIGNSLPRYTYGINLGADWNGFDMSVFLQGVGRQHWYPDKDAVFFWGPYARPYSTFIPSDFLSKVWTPENPNAYFPRPRGYLALDQSGDRSLGVVNDKYLQNLAYCRLKNITVGYTLPMALTSKIKIDKCRIYFSGENLLTFSPLKTDYIDPEQASAENSYTKGSSTAKLYPWSKTFSFGIDITF